MKIQGRNDYILGEIPINILNTDSDLFRVYRKLAVLVRRGTRTRRHSFGDDSDP